MRRALPSSCCWPARCGARAKTPRRAGSRPRDDLRRRADRRRRAGRSPRAEAAIDAPIPWTEFEVDGQARSIDAATVHALLEPTMPQYRRRSPPARWPRASRARPRGSATSSSATRVDRTAKLELHARAAADRRARSTSTSHQRLVRQAARRRDPPPHAAAHRLVPAVGADPRASARCSRSSRAHRGVPARRGLLRRRRSRSSSTRRATRRHARRQGRRSAPSTRLGTLDDRPANAVPRSRSPTAEIQAQFKHECCLIEQLVLLRRPRGSRARSTSRTSRRSSELFHKRGYPGVRVQTDFDPKTSFDRRTQHGQLRRSRSTSGASSIVEFDGNDPAALPDDAAPQAADVRRAPAAPTTSRPRESARALTDLSPDSAATSTRA